MYFVSIRKTDQFWHSKKLIESTPVDNMSETDAIVAYYEKELYTGFVKRGYFGILEQIERVETETGYTVHLEFKQACILFSNSYFSINVTEI